MINELFNTTKISSLLKNKYGNFILQKAIMVLDQGQREKLRDYLVKQINSCSQKEKSRIMSLIELL
jgi:hypothetical protein